MDCLFCKIANKEEEADIVYEDDDVIAFKDIEPKAPQHIVVASKKHIDSVKKLEKQHEELAGKLITAAKKIAEQEEAEGYKLVFNVGKKGGQLVQHIHLHLLVGEPKQWP